MKIILLLAAIGSFLFSSVGAYAQASPVSDKATDPTGFNLEARFNELYAGQVKAKVVTFATTTNIDFNAAGMQTITATGALTLTATHLVAGRTVIVRVIASGGTRALTLPAWVNANATPASVASGKTGLFILRCFGTTVGDIVASYVVQP